MSGAARLVYSEFDAKVWVASTTCCSGTAKHPSAEDAGLRGASYASRHMRHALLRCLVVAACARCTRCAPSGTGTPPALRRIIDTLLPAGSAEALIYIKAQSAFVREESVALSDQTASLLEAYDELNNTVVAVPGSYWEDAAAGKVIIIGVSATFQVGNAALVVGGIPAVGRDIPVSTIMGMPNIPGNFIAGGRRVNGPRRRLQEETQTSYPRRRLLSSDDASLAVKEGFVTDLLTMLPPPMRRNVVTLLSGGRNFTLAAPQLPPNVLTANIVSFFDIEFSVRPLVVSNERAISTRIGPTNRFGSDGTISNGFILAPTITSFFTPTVQEYAADAAAALRYGAALLRGGSAGGQGGVIDSLQNFLQVEFGPLPIALTLEFDVLFRAQLTVNDADIAAVV